MTFFTNNNGTKSCPFDSESLQSNLRDSTVSVLYRHDLDWRPNRLKFTLILIREVNR